MENADIVVRLVFFCLVIKVFFILMEDAAAKPCPPVCHKMAEAVGRALGRVIYGRRKS